VVQREPEQLAGVQTGQILAGKYRVERVLGVGGMGAVVAAHHVQLDTKVAIKFLLPDMIANRESVDRFAREARAAVKITSEHVARVFDVGTLENGAPYIVMEFLDGTDLAGWIKQRGPLSFEDAVDFLLQACVAIAEAHALGIVHRDLKPANLFCIRSADGRQTVKVLDFGISKVTNPSASAPSLGLTHTAALMGSPFYMSPEQMESTRGVDARTDIWALGIILFELLTGKVPFYGETVPEVSLKIATRAPPPLRSVRPDAPEGLEATILRCLEKDRERRYGNVADLALALLPFAPKRAKASVEKIAAIVRATGLSATLSPSSLSDATQLSPSSTIAPFGRTATTSKGSKAKIGTFAVLGLVAIAGAALGLRRLTADPQATQTGAASTAATSGAASGECAPNAARCNGTIPVSCTGGHWTNGAVTAGQCGATCTPGSAAAGCIGDAPQTCSPTGVLETGSRCPYACSEGACVGVCVPGNTQCANAGAMQTCGSDGRWETPVSCSKASGCRNGACALLESGKTPPPPRQHLPGPPPPPAATPTAAPPKPKPDCEPNFTFDDQGRKHFKPECF
jgi:serine/threonine-protein kinase